MDATGTSPLPSPPPADNRLQAFPRGLPAELTFGRRRFGFVRQFKHDFFAATGLYQADDGGALSQVVLKLQRQRPYFCVPMRWLGAWLTRHEAVIYRDLADVPGVPALVGLHGPTGFVHEFVPGQPLHRDNRVSDTFFDELADLLRAIHARGLAYVDLNKRQNILVGQDGRPYLIDFQISFRLGRRGGELPRSILKMLQEHDWYHFAKHKRRCRPDQMTADEIAASYQPTGPLSLHRRISRPYFKVRRWLLTRMGLPTGDAAEG
ncbi:MAG: hypothetical protein BIFFINMI_00695 [Phycisphaerae bacterium]|nr:hypothetical protein [Phycisphaerae bacterium]